MTRGVIVRCTIGAGVIVRCIIGAGVIGSCIIGVMGTGKKIWERVPFERRNPLIKDGKKLVDIYW